MSGILIPILPKQRFDYSFLGMNTSKDIVLFQALNLIPFKSARLLVRVHDISHTGNGGFNVTTYTTAPSAEDPTEFSDNTASLLCSVDSSSAAGDLVVDTDANIAPFIKVVVTATQDSLSSVTLYAELSADLIVREF